jgi:hypothetical protein
MNKTRPIEITEAAYAELNENCGGFCIECRDVACGVEPDAAAGDRQGRSSTIQPRRGSSWA